MASALTEALNEWDCQSLCLQISLVKVFLVFLVFLVALVVRLVLLVIVSLHAFKTEMGSSD